MYENITSDNVMMFAIKHYDNPQCEGEKEFEDANINVPRAIAKAAAANPNVKRLIHISAAGADPNSQSMRLRTKWIGE